jgi:hypothetical protein
VPRIVGERLQHLGQGARGRGWHAA